MVSATTSWRTLDDAVAAWSEGPKVNCAYAGAAVADEASASEAGSVEPGGGSWRWSSARSSAEANSKRLEKGGGGAGLEAISENDVEAEASVAA